MAGEIDTILMKPIQPIRRNVERCELTARHTKRVRCRLLEKHMTITKSHFPQRISTLRTSNIICCLQRRKFGGRTHRNEQHDICVQSAQKVGREVEESDELEL